MCTGFEIAALAATVGGTALQMKSASDAEKNQQKILNRAAEETEKKNVQRQNLVEDFTAENYDPTTRDANYEASATKQEDSLVDALTKANGGSDGEINTATTGNISNDFTRAKAASTALATKDIMNRARLMARSGANGNLLQSEAIKRGDLNSSITGIQSDIARNNGATQLALQGAQDRGSLVGGLLQAAGPGITKLPGLLTVNG